MDERRVTLHRGNAGHGKRLQAPIWQGGQQLMRGRLPEPVAAPGVAEPVELNPVTWRPAARSLSPPQATEAISATRKC